MVQRFIQSNMLFMYYRYVFVLCYDHISSVLRQGFPSTKGLSFKKSRSIYKMQFWNGNTHLKTAFHETDLDIWGPSSARKLPFYNQRNVVLFTIIFTMASFPILGQQVGKDAVKLRTLQCLTDNRYCLHEHVYQGPALLAVGVRWDF